MKWSFCRRNDLNFLTLSRGMNRFKTLERERQPQNREIRGGQDDSKAETDFCPATPTQVLIAGVGQCKKIPPKVAPKPRKDSNYRAIHLKALQGANIFSLHWIGFNFISWYLNWCSENMWRTSWYHPRLQWWTTLAIVNNISVLTVSTQQGKVSLNIDR